MTRSHAFMVFAALVTGAMCTTPVQLLAEEAPNPLAPFEKLVGHEWHLDGTVQVMEWGLGMQSVVARSYLVVEGGRKLVGEGMWYWHPGEQKIRGVFTAIMMPVSFFEYATRFEGDTMINDLVTYTPKGEREVHRETWKMSDEAYEWTLYAVTDEGERRTMGGTYVKKDAE